ncbi:MAG TPA: NADH-quinone oxidoreductase subunit C [Lacunisphaera sp.]|jgi:ech hydrogenase subunit D|nr:NADH-quinone oxidoreductase subunit C [Lacunisphaera sp.]
MGAELIEVIPWETLRERVAARRGQGCRLVQISATRLGSQVELTYSFDLSGWLDHLRVVLPGPETRLPSITGIYGCAVLYENEIKDLFGVEVDGLALDFHGNFYRTRVPRPFGNVATECVFVPPRGGAAVPPTPEN